MIVCPSFSLHKSHKICFIYDTSTIYLKLGRCIFHRLMHYISLPALTGCRSMAISIYERATKNPHTNPHIEKEKGDKIYAPLK